MLLLPSFKWLQKLPHLPVPITTRVFADPFALYLIVVELVPDQYVKPLPVQNRPNAATAASASASATANPGAPHVSQQALTIPLNTLVFYRAIHETLAAFVAAKPHLTLAINWLDVATNNEVEIERVCQMLMLVVLNSDRAQTAMSVLRSVMAALKFEQAVEHEVNGGGSRICSSGG